MKWNCTGIKERLETLEGAEMSASVYRAVKSLINLIDVEMSDPDNNTARLRAYRYRAERLLKSI